MSVKPSTALLETVGGRLYLTRLALGFDSQKKLTDQFPSISTSLWNNWETDDNEPTRAAIEPFYERFNVSLDWIYRGDASALRGDLWLRICEVLEGQPAGPGRTRGARSGRKTKAPAN